MCAVQRVRGLDEAHWLAWSAQRLDPATKPVLGALWAREFVVRVDYGFQ